MKSKVSFFAVIFIGLIYFLPHIFMLRWVDSSYVHLPFSFAETLYGAQVKELLDGHWSVGDPQLWEHKNTFPSVFPYLPIFLLAILSKMSGSIVNGFYLTDFIFPSFLCWTLIAFGKKLTGRRDVATLIAFVTLILYPFFLRFPPLNQEKFTSYFQELVLLTIENRLPFYRTPNPQISFMFLIIALWALFNLWKEAEWKKAGLTIILGSLLYSVYFYHVTYFVAVAGILMCISLLKKEKMTFLHLFTTTTCLMLVGLVYLMVIHREIYATLHITGGRFDARYIDWLYSIRYGGLTLFLYWLLSRNKVVSSFLIALPIAGILVMNFQLFTGWTIQPGHWPQTTIEPMLLFAVTIGFISKFAFLTRAKVLSFLVIGIALYGIGTQTLYPLHYRNVWAIPKDLFHTLSWVDRFVPVQSVIASLDVESLAYIPVLTSANIFLPVEEYHYATIPEIWERIFYAYALYKIPSDQFDPSRLPLVTYFELTYNVNKYKHEVLTNYSKDIQEKIINCYPSLCSTVYALPNDTHEEMKKKYVQIQKENNPYRVDYAIFSDREEKLGATPPNGELVFVSGTYRVYKLKNSGISQQSLKK